MGCVLGLHALAESVSGRDKARHEEGKSEALNNEKDSKSEKRKEDNKENEVDNHVDNKGKEENKGLSRLTAVTLHNPNPASSSQVDFFRMLDEKIDQGDSKLPVNGDLDSASIDPERLRDSFEQWKRIITDVNLLHHNHDDDNAKKEDMVDKARSDKKVFLLSQD